MKHTILCALLVSACGSPHRLQVDPRLQPYLDSYLSFAPDEGNLKLIDNIGIGNPGNGKEGVCERNVKIETFLRTNRNIIVAEINLNDWYGAKVIFHEMGHCLHGLKHSSNPDDIMYDERYDDDTREEFWKEHIYERLSAMFENQID